MTVRFVAIAHRYKRDLDGHLVGHGSPWSLDDLPLDRMCSFVWWYATRNLDEADRAKVEAKLWRPMLGEEPDPQSPWSPEREQEAFAAVKAALSL